MGSHAFPMSKALPRLQQRPQVICTVVIKREIPLSNENEIIDNVKKVQMNVASYKKYLCSELKASWLGFYLAGMSYLFRGEELGLC